MPAVSASAPGKIILLGEHAVVYDRPAIAVPINAVHAKAAIFATPLAPSKQVRIEAQAIDLDQTLDQLPSDHPFATAITGVLTTLGISALPACHIRISSTIPIAAGMGSSAAVSVALVRAISTFLGHPLPDDAVNAIAFRVEQRLHGNPSGVDNSVITYGQPVFFFRKHPIQFIHLRQSLELLVADSGVSATTGPMVAGVNQRYQSSPDEYNDYFDQITILVNQGRTMLEGQTSFGLGPLLTENHCLLQKIGVSTPELDRLVEAALQNGAAGAKLTGGGGGGNMIALVENGKVEKVTAALLSAGAHKTWLTNLVAVRE